jgi:hypothetical protein
VCVSARLRSVSLALLLCALVYPRAFAQMDFSGDWAPSQHEDSIANPYIGEFVGIPMSAAGLARANTWEPSSETLPEWQCRPHGFAYISRGPSQPRIWKEVDPDSRAIIAWHVEFLRNESSEPLAIYMDGRATPPEDAVHTWGGFSTGEWEGQKLRITTTHLTEGYYRRNGVPQSDQAKLITYWIRHGDYLVWANIAYDPVYLSEPLVRSSEEVWVPNQEIQPYPCTVVDEEDRPVGTVPSYMPGQNAFLEEWGKKYNLTEDYTQGGAATMYPEAARKLIRARNEAPKAATNEAPKTAGSK